MRTALVTGGAGFIGSHMVDLLIDRGWRVRVLDDLSGGRLSNLDGHARDPRLAVEEADIRLVAADAAVYRDLDAVIHFAGIGDIVPSIERPADYASVNVMGAVAALEGARAGGARRFVYAASSSCYGLAEAPTREDHPIRPEHPYALSKWQGEEAARHWAKVYGLSVNVIRIFNAYGPRVRTTGAYGAVFGVFLRQRLAGAPFTVVGDGAQRRDFLFVTDVARAFLAAAETPLSDRVWNLGAGDPQSVNRLVALLGGAEGHPVVHIPKRPGEPDVTWADISAIRADLGWEPETSFEDGVAAMLADLDAWSDAPLWTPESIAGATATWFRHLSDAPS